LDTFGKSRENGKGENRKKNRKIEQTKPKMDTNIKRE
jgi:hypothetical protein